MNTAAPTEAYPLSWPVGWKRTVPHQRKRANFHSTSREYLVLDEKKVREAINRGERSIPGLVIEESVQAAIR